MKRDNRPTLAVAGIKRKVRRAAILAVDVGLIVAFVIVDVLGWIAGIDFKKENEERERHL